MQRIKILAILMIAVGLTAGCAKQGYPSGGPSDKTPPKVTKMEPENESTHFVDRGFYIAFDEYVTLKDAENNILVSPPMKTKPTYTIKGKGVRVDIKDTLQENTTYLFQFKDAIADFNEGNLLHSVEYVFTTGSTLDSMQLSGQVVDAMGGGPRKEKVTVMLYKAPSNDSAVVTENPQYITKCDENGRFEFNHIQAGSYRMVALEDGDKNLRMGNTEAIAFVDYYVEAKERPHGEADTSRTKQDTAVRTVGMVLRMYEPVNEVQRITSANFVGRGRAVVTTMLPMREPVVSPLCDTLHWRLNATRDTMTIWTVEEKTDTLRMVVSDASGLKDTIRLRYQSPKKGTTQKAEPLMRLSVGKQMAYFDTVELLFSTPLKGHDQEATVEVMSLKDSTTERYRVEMNGDQMRARIPMEMRQGERYRIKVGEKIFTDIYGRQNDTLTLETEVSTAAKYGSLVLNVAFAATCRQYIIQLMDEKDKIVEERVVDQEAEGEGKIRFDHLKAGKYRVRTIKDANCNGKWDAGDYWKKVLPEEVRYFEKTMEIRENWDFEENWKID